MAEKWIPNYIKREIKYNPRDILSAQEYNAILNLIIAQGDYNSSWLDYMQNEAIPEAIRDISVEELEEVLSTVVREEIAALSASVENKANVQLDHPMCSILNTGLGVTGVLALDTLLTSKSFKATYAVATNLIDSSSAYPTLVQLNTLKTAGNDIVAYSTDGVPLTTSAVRAAVEATLSYMTTNNFNTAVFVYPEGTNDNEVKRRVCLPDRYMYGVNIINNGNVDPTGFIKNANYTIRGDIAVVHVDNTVSVNTVKAYIDDAVQYNKYIILQVNTDTATYDASEFEDILDYLLTKAGIVYPESITAAMQIIHSTIGNSLEYLTHVSEALISTVETLSNNKADAYNTYLINATEEPNNIGILGDIYVPIYEQFLQTMGDKRRKISTDNLFESAWSLFEFRHKRPAEEDGTDGTIVTTGDKYNWDQKVDPTDIELLEDNTFNIDDAIIEPIGDTIGNNSTFPYYSNTNQVQGKRKITWGYLKGAIQAFMRTIFPYQLRVQTKTITSTAEGSGECVGESISYTLNNNTSEYIFNRSCYMQLSTAIQANQQRIVSFKHSLISTAFGFEVIAKVRGTGLSLKYLYIEPDDATVTGDTVTLVFNKDYTATVDIRLYIIP